MIELQLKDIKMLDLVLKELCKNTTLVLNAENLRDNWLIVNSEKYTFENEFERICSIFKFYDCAEIVRIPFSKVYIKRNSNTFQFNSQRGFEKLYETLKEKRKRENFEYKKSKVDFKLANKMLEEFPKTKLFSRIGAFIGIGLAVLEIIEWIMKLM